MATTMACFTRGILLATLLLVPGRVLGAPPGADPTGHWEGTLQVPNKVVAFEIDVARNARGELVGTFSNPAEGENGLPLATITVAGREVSFAIHATSGGGAFRGTLRDDGRAITGDFTLQQGGTAIPFQLGRTGDARLAPPPRSAPISKRLEGSWTGTLSVDGKQLAIGLAMANQPDGTATGTITSSGLELPIAITQSAARVRIEVPSVGGAYAGVLNAAGTELTGTWTQRSLSLPLTFRRGAK
jgi:hypothetical protein